MRPPITPSESGTSLVVTGDGFYDARGKPIVNVDDPIDPQDVATRAYVDRGGTVYDFWTCSTNVVMANPSNGQVRFNAATPDAATQLALSTLASNNLDYTTVLEQLIPGDQLYMQVAADSSQFARYELPTAPVKQTSGSSAPWWLVDVTLLKTEGVVISGNQKTGIAFARVGNTVTKALVDVLRAQRKGTV